MIPVPPFALLFLLLGGVCAVQSALFYQDMRRIERDMKEHWRRYSESLEKEIVELRASPLRPRLQVHLDLKTGKLEATLLLPTHPKN